MKEHKLIAAIIKRNNSLVKQLLNSGEDPNLCEKSRSRRSPAITVALINENLNAAEMLLNAGANINACDVAHCTPLHNAVTSGKVSSLLCLLNKQGIVIDAMSKIGESALMLAAKLGNADIAKILIDNGADVGLVTKPENFNFRRIALTYDALYGKCGKLGGSSEICMMLLDAGADVNHKDEHEKHIWELAACNDDIKALLLAYREQRIMDADIKTSGRQNALEF